MTSDSGEWSVTSSPVQHEHSVLCSRYIIGESAQCDCRGYHSTVCAIYNGGTCNCGLDMPAKSTETLLSRLRAAEKVVNETEQAWMGHIRRCPKNHDTDIHGNTECDLGEALFRAYMRARAAWLEV